jgi:two-component system sensor histidine kinase ChiS
MERKYFEVIKNFKHILHNRSNPVSKYFKLCSFFIFIPIIIIAQPQDIEFEHLTTEDGLSNNFVRSIVQDSSGFMWFGTLNGLNRWDGYEFKLYSHNPFDSNTISSNQIYTIYIDSFDILWVGTEHGLNKFDVHTERFKRYITRHDSVDFIKQNRVTEIIEDDSSNIWYSTECGICKLDVETYRTERYLVEPKDANPPANIIYTICNYDKEQMLVGSIKRLLCFNYKTKSFTPVNQLKELYLEKYLNVNTILMDKNKMLWLGTERGLLKLNLNKKGYEQFIQNPEDPLALSSSGVVSLCEDRNGRLWIGTHGGLNLMYRNTEKFISYKNNSSDSKGINSNSIMKIFEDTGHNLWIGSRDKGINIIFKWEKPFIPYIHKPGKLKGLGYGEVSAIVEDKSGNVWVAQFGGGLNKLNNKSERFEHYYDSPNSKIRIGNSFVQDVYEDKEGNIWVGSVGLDRINPKTNTVFHYNYNPASKNSIGGFAINPIYEDKSGTLWLGCLANGLDRFDKNKGTFEHFKFDPTDSMSISNNQILSICQDSNENLWVGTIDGLCKLIYLKNNKYGFKRFKNNPLNPLSISNNIIYEIFEDSKNRLWIGTEYGLNLFNYENDSFTRYTTEKGFPSNCIFAILEDNNGNLWLRSDIGLIKFNVEEMSFRIYNESDGLLDCRTIEWGHKAFHKGRSGKFYYGGQSSLTVFYPDSIKDNPNPPQIVLTDFKLKNKSVEISDSSYLKKDINYAGTIELPYYENIFSIEFAALDYTTPAKNQYAYELLGFHDDWTYTDAKNRIASYTNLDPGEYTFRVIGSNCDGVWNKVGASVNIIILPPWWATWWFRSIAIALFLSGFIFLYKLRVNHLKLEKIRQEEFSKKLIESQEGERKRIAGELHDSLGQNLMIIYNDIQQFSQRKEIAPNELKSLFPEVKETIEEVREIARNLHPHQLEQLGLTKAVKSIIKKLSNSTKINFYSNIEFIDEFLPQELWIHVYRILQEALTNIIKHSEATEVKIELKRSRQNIFMLIEDNGIGIKSIIEKTKNGFGLENLKERARLLDAKLEISSPLQKGVKILMYIPIKPSSV